MLQSFLLPRNSAFTLARMFRGIINSEIRPSLIALASMPKEKTGWMASKNTQFLSKCSQLTFSCEFTLRDGYNVVLLSGEISPLYFSEIPYNCPEKSHPSKFNPAPVHRAVPKNPNWKT